MKRWNNKVGRMLWSVYTKQKKNTTIWYSLLLLTLVGGYILLQPKVASSLIISIREDRVEALIGRFTSQPTINPQDFWQWREHYSPGVIIPNTEFISFTDTYHMQKISSPSAVLLWYKSPYVESTESVVHKSLIEKHGGYFDRAAAVDKKIVYLEDQKIVYFPNQDTLSVSFAQPISAMKMTVGLFNFTQEEMALLKDYYWVSQSIIKL